MRTALAIGDANGVGPELAAKLLAHSDMADRDVIIVGDARIFKMGQDHAGVTLDIPVLQADELVNGLPSGKVFVDLANFDPAKLTLGQSSAEAGKASLQNFAAVLRLADAGLADVAMFTPFNKHSMRLSRPSYIDEIGFIDSAINAARSGREFNVLDEVWNARVTSHIPLREVASKLSVERILDSLRLTDEVLTGAGKPNPRIGVAALNPHAGDGRNFGHEDDDIIAPAVEQAVAEGINAKGPIPSDTVFVRAIRGEFDAVMTMYHDQGQIAMKLIGFDRGVTLIAGYGFPLVTPAHGTAFDIAGQGKADLGATLAAANLGVSLAKLNPVREKRELQADWAFQPVA